MLCDNHGCIHLCSEIPRANIAVFCSCFGTYKYGVSRVTRIYSFWFEADRYGQEVGMLMKGIYTNKTEGKARNERYSNHDHYVRRKCDKVFDEDLQQQRRSTSPLQASIFETEGIMPRVL